MYINGMKQEMDEDLFDHMAEAPPPIRQHPQPTNHNIHTMETARGDFNDFKRNYQPLSPVPTAGEQSRANPIYQSTVKPTDVSTADVIDELLNSNLLNNK